MVLAILAASDRVTRPSSFRSPADTVMLDFLDSLRETVPSLLRSAV